MSKTLNKVTFIGFIHNNPTISYLANGKQVATFLLKTYSLSQVDSTGGYVMAYDLHRCIVWNDVCKSMESDIVDKHFVYVSGRLKYREVHDKKRNSTYQAAEIQCDDFKLLAKPK